MEAAIDRSTTESQVAQHLKGLTQKADQTMLYFLAGYFFFGLFLAGFYDTWTIAFGVGGISMGVYLLTRFLLPEYKLYQYVGSAILAVFMAQFIYQMHGMFEMHFTAFVGALVVLSYRNWRLQIPLLLTIAVHHGLFAYLQYSGMGEIYFTQLDYMDLTTFAFHVGLAAVIIGLAGYWAYQSEQDARASASNHANLENRLMHMDQNIAFAEEISKGNLEAEYDNTENDEMGRSLLNMREGLLEAARREESEKYKNVGIAEISEILRRNMANLDDLTSQLVSKMVQYLDANQCGLFLIQEEGDEAYFELAACYAYDRQKFLNKRIELREGLIGASYLERDIIFMTDVPDDYMTITSGLGTANPGCLLIVPLMSNEEIVGVIEIASFKKLEEFQVDFVKRAAESIASTIVSARITERTNSLLEESRKLTEEMQAQEEEMRQNMEEMQATQEEMKRAQQELRDKQSNLDSLINNTDDTIFAIDSDYTITIVNETLKKKYQSRGIELEVGRNILEIIPVGQRDFWKQRYDRALGGEKFTTMEEREYEDGTHHIETYHYPIYNESGTVIGVSVMSKDRTAQIEKRKEIERKESMLSSLIDSSDDTFFAMNSNYEVTVVNQTLKKKYEGTVDEVFVGKNVLQSMNPERAAEWKIRYDKVLAGEKIEETIEQKQDDGSTRYMEAQINPIRNEDGRIIGVAVIGRNVTDKMSIVKEVERKEAILSSLIDNTDDTYFALDSEYRITVANRALQQRYQKTGLTLGLGENIFDKLPTDQHDFWKEKYDRVLTGESFRMTQERPTEDRVLTLEVDYNPVKDRTGNIIGASVISRDITRWTEEAKNGKEMVND